MDSGANALKDRTSFWVFLSDNAKLRDLQRRFGEANATPNTSGAAPWLEDRGSLPSYPLTLTGLAQAPGDGRPRARPTPRKFWLSRLPPALGLVVLVIAG